MLNIVLFLLDLIEQHTIWVYAVCAVVVLFNVRAYTLARRDRVNTIFPVEREVAAHNEGRAMSGIATMLGIAIIVTALKYYIVPSVNVSALVEPTPTVTLMIPTRVPTPTEVVETPTATPRPRPTLQPTSIIVPPRQRPYRVQPVRMPTPASQLPR